eukprot:CAMPEP_0174740110 /NCGR_PEP_ID=MMETSP1094-20130205/72721_1 /TAXON_ID=156173 /ORGANISM="Chrysochromulina brevifilum, Strain UTEX LB 985" /LENGTH=42 /DNA_ID= /DNA_START= /DNA_END= /DNA_ORIENTATION=
MSSQVLALLCVQTVALCPSAIVGPSQARAARAPLFSSERPGH